MQVVCFGHITVALMPGSLKHDVKLHNLNKRTSRDSLSGSVKFCSKLCTTFFDAVNFKSNLIFTVGGNNFLTRESKWKKIEMQKESTIFVVLKKCVESLKRFGIYKIHDVRDLSQTVA